MYKKGSGKKETYYTNVGKERGLEETYAENVGKER
jgi:hypothetical protein